MFYSFAYNCENLEYAHFGLKSIRYRAQVTFLLTQLLQYPVRCVRLWSIHPSYLDWKGLGGLWREALLAQAVLLNRTRGWKNHPQLLRFKNHRTPISAIGYYLLEIHGEARRRGYSYDKSKIVESVETVEPITITDGQLIYELVILKERLKKRDPKKYGELLKLEEAESRPKPHPIFIVIEGEVEPWERSYWSARITHET